MIQRFMRITSIVLIFIAGMTAFGCTAPIDSDTVRLQRESPPSERNIKPDPPEKQIIITETKENDANSGTPDTQNSNTAPEKQSATNPTGIPAYTIRLDTTNVDGVTGEVGLGFNNAEQTVDAGNGLMFTVWVSDNKLILATRDKNGNVTKTQTIAEGQIILPALAKARDMVAITWAERNIVKVVISTNGGASFSAVSTLGNGTGPSVAADNGTVVAVWQDGKEGSLPSKIMFDKYSNGAWSGAKRIDTSDKTPLWPAVTYKNNTVFAVWRDNRGGNAYTIWLRRSFDIGATWQDEQNIVSDLSGDPDICTPDGKIVYVGYHGKGKISLLDSNNGGKSFGNSKIIGDGYFAHLSCTGELVGLAWESTLESAKASNKKVGWAIFRADGTLMGQGDIADGETAASTIYVGESEAEVLWVRNNANPLAGTLRHILLSLNQSPAETSSAQPPAQSDMLFKFPPVKSHDFLPDNGPWSRDVWVTESVDGTTFGPAKILVARAGVPSITKKPDGKIIAAFQWFPENNSEHFDQVAIIFSTDNGVNWSVPQPMKIANLPDSYQRPFDPTIITLPDGRIRMYFTSTSGLGSPPGIFSAVSSDGLNYIFENGQRFGVADTAVVDPAVGNIGAQWHMFSPKPDGGAYHNMSKDGLVFTKLPDLPPRQAANWLGNAIPIDEGFRFYGSGSKIWWSYTRDGEEWTPLRYTNSDGADPAVVKVSESKYIMIYVGHPRQ